MIPNIPKTIDEYINTLGAIFCMPLVYQESCKNTEGLGLILDIKRVTKVR